MISTISTSLRPSNFPIAHPLPHKVTSNPATQIQFGNENHSKSAEEPSEKTRPASASPFSSLLKRYHLNQPRSYPRKDIDHVLKLAEKEGDFQGISNALLQAALKQLSEEMTQWNKQCTKKASKFRGPLYQQAEQIIGELVHRQKVQFLTPYLSDLHLRRPILRAMLYHNTPKNNYRLSQTLELPEYLSDSSHMEFRKHDRTLPMYENLFKLQLERLNGQKILLVGGGKSPIKEGLAEARVNAHVTNIDKFFPEPDPRNEDLKIGKDFYDPEVNEHLQPNTYDEIWAYYSLPQYADTKEEVKALYQKSIGALRTGGTLRVFPTQMAIRPNRPIRKSEAANYPDYLWLGLNDVQTLSRPYLYQQSEKIMNRLKKRPDLFRLETFSVPPSDSDYGSYSSHETGTNITLLGTPEVAQAYLGQETLTKKLHKAKRLFALA